MARRPVSWARASILVLIAGAAFVVVLRKPANSPPLALPDRPAPNIDRFYLKGIEYSAYVRGEKAFTLSADEIVHRQRKLGPLTINPIKEVEMNGVRIEIFSDVAPAGGAGGSPTVADGHATLDLDVPISSILKESLSAKDLGFVSRVVMNRFHLAFLLGDTEQVTFEAGKAGLGLDSTVLKLDGGFTLSTSAGGRLEAQSAEWRFDRRRLYVPGDFVLKQGPNMHRGQAASFRIGLDGRLTQEAGSLPRRP